jgi:hypothetical protein
VQKIWLIAKALKVFSFKMPIVMASDVPLIASAQDGKGKMLTHTGKLADTQDRARRPVHSRSAEVAPRARQAQTVGVRTGGDRQQSFLSRTWKRLDRSELKK